MPTNSFLKFNRLRKDRAKGKFRSFEKPDNPNRQSPSLLPQPSNRRPLAAGSRRRDQAPIADQLQNKMQGRIQGGFKPNSGAPRGAALGHFRNRPIEQRKFSRKASSAMEMLRTRLDSFRGGRG